MTTFELGQTIASGVTALFTVCTFGALIWYTVETKRLRVAAQKQVAASEKQNEHLLLPILFLGKSSKPESIGPYVRAEHMVLRNVGSGPAFNAFTDPLVMGDVRIEFEHDQTIAAGEEKNVNVFIETQKISLDQLVRFWNYLHTLPDRSGTTAITYKGANGSVHKITVTFKTDGHQIIFEKRESFTGPLS